MSGGPPASRGQRNKKPLRCRDRDGLRAMRVDQPRNPTDRWCDEDLDHRKVHGERLRDPVDELHQEERVSARVEERDVMPGRLRPEHLAPDLRDAPFGVGQGWGRVAGGMPHLAEERGKRCVRSLRDRPEEPGESGRQLGKVGLSVARAIRHKPQGALGPLVDDRNPQVELRAAFADAQLDGSRPCRPARRGRRGDA